MTTIDTIHGLKFGFETDGFGRHEADADAAIDAAATMIERMKPAAAFALWAAAKHLGYGEFDGRVHPVMDRMTNLAYRAVKRAIRKWIDNSGCFLSISAIDPE